MDASVRSSRILVVDDDPLNRDVLSRRLQRLGHRSVAAESGPHALQQLRGEACDLVLLDIMMPGMDGHGVLAQMKQDEALRDIPVIVISALEDPDTIVRCLENGADDYLTKPFNPHILRARVECALTRKRVQDMEREALRSMERELEIGRAIQRGFLPDSIPRPDGWEIATRFRPARQVAGDFYDVFEIPGIGIAMVIADVCDKGVGAAMYMALFRSLLHAGALRDATVVEPARVVIDAMAQTNDYIATVHDRANMFATVFFAVLDPDSGRLVYVNAGHDPPVLVGRDGVRGRLQPTAAALGLAADLRMHCGTECIGAGELLFAYTDGVVDAAGRDAVYGEERLLALLGRCPPSAEALLDELERSVEACVAGVEPFDDITVMAVRRLG